jgi:signal transduction histidine kinase
VDEVGLPQGFIQYCNRMLMSKYPNRLFCFSNLNEMMIPIKSCLRELDIDPSADDVIYQRLSSMGIQSGVKVEIDHHGVPYGVISLYHREPDGKCCKEKVDVLRNIAMHLGEALYQTELYQQALMAKEEAEAANRKKSQFLATVSHELRTPLNAIIGYSQMLGGGYGGTLSDKQERYSRNILNSGQHLLDMVEELLDVSRIEAGKLTVLKEELDLGLFLNDLKPLFEQRAELRHLHLDMKLGPDVQGLYADPSRLRQILINLLSNAVKFNREGGAIHLRVHNTADGKRVRFEMEDTGIGIPRDKQTDLFREFYQIDNSYARAEEGLGLGLALTKKLVELHGGTIHVESQPDVGSTFSFELPRF